MKKYGLIGFPLSHSASKKYFEEKFTKENIEAVYDLFPSESIHDLGYLVFKKGIHGCNVTTPFKKEVYKYVDEQDEIAQSTGSINVILPE